VNFKAKHHCLGQRYMGTVQCTASGDVGSSVGATLHEDCAVHSVGWCGKQRWGNVTLGLCSAQRRVTWEAAIVLHFLMLPRCFW